jgi:hypothetical protein
VSETISLTSINSSGFSLIKAECAFESLPLRGPIIKPAYESLITKTTRELEFYEKSSELNTPSTVSFNCVSKAEANAQNSTIGVVKSDFLSKD